MASPWLQLGSRFLLGVWQGFCKSQWRSTWKSPAKGPHNESLVCCGRQKLEPKTCSQKWNTYPSLRAPLAGLRLWLKRLRLRLWQNNGFFGEAKAIL
jgi:hypothetical protein